VADVRGSSAWPEPPAGGGGRYDANASSRFGTGAAVDQSLTALPAANALPAALDPLPPAASPAAAPVGFPSSPAAVPAPSTPGEGPVRRPDPGYRPGGTSSYRPSRAILAGDPPAGESGGVRTVGFETPADAAR
jgi:hypothetical protein